MRRLLHALLILLLALPLAAMSPTERRTLFGPAAGPSFDLNFATAPNPDGRLVFTRASKRTCIDAAGNMQELPNDVYCIDHALGTGAFRGLLVELQRTNLVRNPRVEGGIDGTFGAGAAWPTNWGSNAFPAGTQVSATHSSERGMACLDIRNWGTLASGGLYLNLFFDTMAVSAGANYTSTVYAKWLTGSASLVSTMTLQHRFDGNGGIQTSNFMPTSTLQRYGFTATSGSTTTSDQFAYSVTYSAGSGGQAIDLTVRVCSPQMEQGSFPTSPIWPPAGTPGASTRAADGPPTISLGSWFNKSAGTVGVVFRRTNTSSENFQAIFSITNCCTFDFMNYYNSNGGGFEAVPYTNNALPAVTDTNRHRVVAGYSTSGRTTYSQDGANAVIAYTSAWTPPPVDRVYLGGGRTATPQGSVWIERFMTWPRTLTDAEQKGASP